ncbi:MAG: alpha/beta fold hydrolase [Actinomycetota bacterium]|nr:alpha/beta fold hydrolase [Actinomycetota bacterium]MDK1017418.1 alpha/beta fold hydrolase [Actinomycetota bacterium]MDK1019613.1 alpha/beta fold hydrolase [Actinomycetota bacterium]MDK1025914.1 alpha/beta fold hydrolase [Actinomycetota bacterium]MDK1038671.1 alpha/beta fold hydrolase [Actinomycetota bacterium]
MRARYPDTDGYVDRDGVKIYYEVYENAGPTVLLMPTWSMFDSRHWKMQIPYLSRHFRVVTFDARGNGKSDRPKEAEAHHLKEYLADAIAVLDETKTGQAFVAGVCLGGYYTLQLAARHPGRVQGIVVFAPASQLSGVYPETVIPERAEYPWDEELDTTEGWAKDNKYHWLRDYPDYVDFFIKQCVSEPHSTKLIEDGIGWALETDGELLVAVDEGATDFVVNEEAVAAYRSITCPVLVIQGTDDHIVSHRAGIKVAELTGGQVVLVGGACHFVHAREPVKANLLIKGFVDRVTGTPPPSLLWTRGLARRKRALYISSPIGLGHARRDVAIAEELRELRPDLEIDWLAQHPVTRVLEDAGERIHPASEHLSSESSHIESEQGEHDLNCFQALRRMDEIILANFMVFQEVVDEGLYDLVIGDEAWDIDYYWHENPELKRCANVWMTDFVGYLPMGDGSDNEAFLTADYNAEMIEHVARFPGVRDQAIFVGNPEDIVPDSFGPDLPLIRDWTEDNFKFSGYVTGFIPPDPEAVAAIRADLGYEDGEQVCVVTIGGSGVGRDLLERVIAAYPEAKRKVPELRMVVVAGPRIDPDSLPSHEGLEVHGYVPRLYRHLSVCDLAVAQGGLTTTMELTAANRPFLYFPLRNHFEQNLHVRHRLERYGAGIHMDYATSAPDAIAEAISSAIGSEVQYQQVETDGAARAASIIAELV